MLVHSWVAERLVASQEGLKSMELFSWNKRFPEFLSVAREPLVIFVYLFVFPEGHCWRLVGLYSQDMRTKYQFLFDYFENRKTFRETILDMKYVSLLLYDVLTYLRGRAVAQGLDVGFPPRRPGFAYGQHVGFVVDKAALGQVFSEYLVSPTNHSTDFSIIIITRGWHNRPFSGRSVEWTLIPSPTMQI
jgi:hypothetical protein